MKRTVAFGRDGLRVGDDIGFDGVVLHVDAVAALRPVARPGGRGNNDDAERESRGPWRRVQRLRNMCDLSFQNFLDDGGGALWRVALAG